MRDKSELTVIAYGSVALKELPVLAGVGGIDNADLVHDMEPGDSVTLDTEPPVTVEVRSP